MVADHLRGKPRGRMEQVRACWWVAAMAVVVAACTGSHAGTTVSDTTAGTSTTSSRPATTIADPGLAPEHLIGVRPGPQGEEFYDRRSGERFVMRGVNYTIRVPVGGGIENRVFAVGVWDSARFDADLASLADRGYNTIRAWIDSCSDGPDCLTATGRSGLNYAYLDNLAEALEIAKAHDMFLLLTSNDIPDGGGYGSQANRGSGPHFAGYRNAHFLTVDGAAAASRYWADILTGLVGRAVPTEMVVAWSLLNEMWVFEDLPPLSLRQGTVPGPTGEIYGMASEPERRRLVADGFVHYIEVVSETIKSHDPTALVTVGFFHPKFPNPSRVGDTWFVDTGPLLERAPVDFFDFHAYPGVDLTITEYAENFGLIGHERRLVVLGEFGAFLFAYPSPQAALPELARFIADSCAVGWDGWLYWEYYQPPRVGDATWGFTDEGGLLRDGLAPINHPDPCDPSPVAPPNLAQGRRAEASMSLPDESPSNAVDGLAETIWGAGAGPPQWLEVTLDGPSTVRRVEVLTSQFPEGTTRHRVYGRINDGSLVILGELEGDTADNQWLGLDGPWEDVAGIRIETVASPSWVGWREIRVLAG